MGTSETTPPSTALRHFGWNCLLLILFVSLCDQLSKFFAARPAAPLTLIPRVLYLQLSHNGGAAWGILSGQRVFLCALAVAVLAGGFLCRSRLRLERKWNRVAFGLIGGGIVGNLLDRLRLGYVVDFIDLHLPCYRWPTFNIADCALCLGVLLYIVTSSTERK
ncbi:MAG: signal peptidase II [Puniceicoccales bacterium]|nr:signal peptidase II [Puniceicoccales bacterium]